MLELLDSTSMAPDQRDNLQIAKRSAEHMLFLVNDLLDVVRIERGKLEICPARFSLREDLEHLWSRFAHSSESHGVDFDVSLSPDLPDIVVGDTHRLAQVLDNILGNAFKFTSRGGRVTFTASLPTTDVYQRLGRSPDDMEQQQQRWVLFSVADTGIGITADKLPHIFDAFYQVDAVHTKKYAGLGMGLKICSELVTFAFPLVSFRFLLLLHFFLMFLFSG
jgi:signal transduction histidine kinase